MTGRIFILSVIALCYLGYREWGTGPVGHPPGVLVKEQPLQVDVPSSVFRYGDYVLTRRARFEVRARVLSKEPYYLGRSADLSPVDLALGWGVMSDSAVLDRIDISQSGRWYHTRYELPPPVDERLMVASSSNMHMIPARKDVEGLLKKLRVGDIVDIRGFLVDVDHESGWHWRSSMSRTDSGDGACELVYVESVSVDDPQ
jgi:hypothetical protein